MVYVLAYNPYVVCNEISTIYNGFNFNGPNDHAVWAGNIMQPLSRGLLLLNGGKIGQHGGPSIANANKWNSTWTYTHTFVDGFSDAQFSKLWVKPVTGYSPTVNSGPINSQLYSAGGNVTVSPGGDYSCGGVPNNISIPLPSSENYPNSNLYYIAKTSFYRFLLMNDSVSGSQTDYSDFIDTNVGTSVKIFAEIEKLIFDGSIALASSSLSSIEDSGFNSVEHNYKSFYTLYLNYLCLAENEDFSISDSIALYNLSHLCPSTEGEIIYQARALYNAIYAVGTDYLDCSEESGARMAQINISEESKVIYNWDVEVFPNPTQNNINIVSKTESEALNISICEVSGRMIISQKLKTVNHFANIDFNLLNGIYFLVIRNSANEKVTKKLVVSK